MPLSDKEIIQLKELHSLLSQTFKGASFGSVKVDSCAKILEKLIEPQSPAVAVPEQRPAYYVNVPAGHPDGPHHFLKPEEWARKFTRCLYEPLYRKPQHSSPRITEQDAREMALSAWRYWMNNCDRTVDNWIEDEGLDLTNKLNGVTNETN